MFSGSGERRALFEVIKLADVRVTQSRQLNSSSVEHFSLEKLRLLLSLFKDIVWVFSAFIETGQWIELESGKTERDWGITSRKGATGWIWTFII